MRRGMGRVHLERAVFALLVLALGGLLAVAALEADDGEVSATSTVPTTPSTGSIQVAVERPTVTAAASASGRRRDRVRVTVPVRLRNIGVESVSLRDAVTLRFGSRRIEPDREAEDDRRVLDLSRRLPSGETRAGEIRFELAGAETRALRSAGRARLVVRAPGADPVEATLPLDVPERDRG